MAMHNGWVKVRGNLWTDERFLALSTHAQLLFIWSWTPPHAAVSGLSRVPQSTIASVVGAEHVDAAMGELVDAGMWAYDDVNEVLWVVNRVKHIDRNKQGVLSPATRRVIIQEYRDTPASHLADAFLDKWGDDVGMRRPALAHR